MVAYKYADYSGSLDINSNYDYIQQNPIKW